MKFIIKDTNDSDYSKLFSELELKTFIKETQKHVEGVVELLGFSAFSADSSYTYYEVSLNPDDVKYMFMNPDIKIKRDGKKLRSFMYLGNKEITINLPKICDEICDFAINVYQTNFTLCFDDTIKYSDNPYMSIFAIRCPVLDVSECSDYVALQILHKFTKSTTMSVNGFDTGFITNSNYVRNRFITEYCFRNPTIIHSLKQFVDEEFLEGYFKDNIGKMLCVLDRRDYPISDICLIGKYVAGINKRMNNVIDYNGTHISSFDLNKGIVNNIQVLDLNKNYYKTEDDSMYLIAAFYTMKSVHYRDDDSNLYMSLRDFFDYIYSKYHSRLLELFTFVFNILFGLLTIILTPLKLLTFLHVKIKKSFSKD